jgi:hypothetical protein
MTRQSRLSPSTMRSPSEVPYCCQLLMTLFCCPARSKSLPPWLCMCGEVGKGLQKTATPGDSSSCGRCGCAADTLRALESARLRDSIIAPWGSEGDPTSVRVIERRRLFLVHARVFSGWSLESGRCPLKRRTTTDTPIAYLISNMEYN